MKRIYNLSLLFFIILLSACNKDRSIYPPSELMPDTIDLRNGDLIFRKGKSNVSRIITTLYPGRFSHIGILYKTGNHWSVIHASEGNDYGEEAKVIITPLSCFVNNNDAETIGTARVKCSNNLSEKATQFALQMARENKAFDTDYNLKDTTKVYCTELVYVVYHSVGIDLLKTSLSQKPSYLENYLFPEELWNNSSVQQMKFKGK